MTRKWLGATVIYWLTTVVACASADFDLQFKTGIRGSESLNLCSLDFPKDVPNKIQVDAIARNAMALCIEADSGKDILLNVSRNDSLVDPSIFDGSLVFDHKTKKINHETNQEIWSNVKPITEH